MFPKVHFRLAILCGGITAFILLVMSFGYLYISEQGLQSSSFTSFQNDMNTLINNLEHQTVITHEWLTKMEDNGKYKIRITDNGIPFLYNEREPEEQQVLFRQVSDYYEARTDLKPVTLSPAMYHVEFPFSVSPNKEADYYVCIASAERKGSTFQIMVLSPLNSLKQQIRRQRFLFLLLNLSAIAALFLFAWHFTKKILKPLEENQKKQIQFIASASHELRTPLSVILSCASASEKASGEERSHFLRSIESEGKRMARLIDDMLLLTTADNHSWTIRTAPVELDTLLLNVFEIFEPVAAKKSLRLSVVLPENAVPPVSCDRERILQVLIILLDNAVSYTPKGGKIRLSLSHKDKNTCILVTDTGPGIPDSEKEHIFDRFYRADTTRTQKEHFGLGLCIAYEIIKAHHGKITVTDTPGGGSTFTIIL